MKKVQAQMNFPELEKHIRDYWKENKIFEKSVGEKGSRPEFVFYDGPPFATGLPHYGHLLQSLVKDIVPRYKTMRGYRVERRWGWDCHGLPIENLVEKELGFKSKKDIESYGIDKFNEACRSKVTAFAEDWKQYVEKFGRFVDMENPYFTMSRDYMESVWWVFKELWDKNLIYQSYRTMHICPRCETTLAQAEVSEGYKDVKDLAVTAKFELADEPGTFVLAWTTTPWTLPGNVALAVGKDIEYVKIIKTENIDEVQQKEYFIIAKDIFLRQSDEIFNITHRKWFKNGNRTEPLGSFDIVETIKGEDLLGKSYLPPFKDYFEKADLENKENGWKIYHADFINTDMGTGIAHEAPAFGEDDMLLGKEHSLPWVQHVKMDGTIVPEVKKFAGMQVKPVEKRWEFDVKIIEALQETGNFFSRENYAHSYPHCWRCDTPLLNYATSSWFVNVEKIKGDLLKNADDITWSPAHVKQGRFGKWLEGARDWSISRQRFWASCMPLWVCDGCDAKEVFGNAKELEERSGQKVEDLHKHVLDPITFNCSHCSGTMRRVPDVLDTWFDSGSMPYASEHYLGEGEPQRFPADFIAEMVEQSRTWFYYQHVLGTALFNSPVFINAIATGNILAEDGKKMSKKLQNYPDPIHVLDTYGADALRLYITTSSVVQAEDMNFNEKDLQIVVRNTMRMLWNSYSFFTTYASIDNWQPKRMEATPKNVLDQWILARLQGLHGWVTLEMDDYQLTEAARQFTPFIDDLSNWYIRQSRKRFWKNENDGDKEEAYQTLYTVLVELSKLMAPFTPFLAEEMYRNLTGEESVHLTEWRGGFGTAYLNSDIIPNMSILRSLITEGLDKRKFKVRQPLSRATINVLLSEDYEEILKNELNVKEVVVDATQKENILVDINLTPELILEGQAREIIRAIQEGRKKAGFNVEDRITLSYQGFEAVFAAHQEEIAKEVLATDISQGERESEYTSAVQIDGEQFTFWLNRI